MKPGPIVACNTDIFRIDKNIAHNIDYISKYHNDDHTVNSDGNLIKNLIYFFCYTYQDKANLFNFGSFDVYRFASQFGYSAEYLKRRHPAPEQLKGLSEPEIKEMYLRQEEDINFKIYDSIIENALYILHTKPIVFIRGAKTVDYKNNEVIYSTDSNSYLVIKQLSVKTIKKLLQENKTFNHKLVGNEGGKKVYNYTLDQLFIENLSHYYLKGNKESLLQLRKSSLDDLYLYLLNLRSNLAVKGIFQTTVTETPAFELLCTIAHVKLLKENGEPYDNKYRKRNLVLCLKEINNRSELKFELNWVKAKNNRFAYTPIFTFEPTVKPDLLKEKEGIFKLRLSHELLETFRILNSQEYYSDNRNQYFIQWLNNISVYEKEIKLAYEAAYFKSYGKLSSFIEDMKRSFVRNCATIKTFEEIQG